jgi:hypothetical protein
VNILFGNGDGTFQPTQDYYSAYSPDLRNASGITSGDINSDGFEDLIVGNNATNCISVYLNTGNNSFNYLMRYGIYYRTYSPFYGDFDEDGINDIAVVVGLPPSGLPGAITYIRGKDVGVVPVELNSFSADVLEDRIILSWITSTETNNSQFVIERSYNSIDYNSIGTVDGKGTTTIKTYYSFEDNDLTSDKRYYRLKQVDYNGTYSYSSIVKVDLGIPAEYNLSHNYPNPFNPTTTIEYTIPQRGGVKLTIFNPLGEEVKTLVNETKEPGNYEIKFNADDLTSGIYIYQLRAGNFIQSKKMILLK